MRALLLLIVAATAPADPGDRVDYTPRVAPMPVPNGRDRFIEAIALLRSAGELRCDPYQPDWVPQPADDPFADDPRLEARAIYVEGNRAALAKLREGLALPYREPPIDDFATPLPHFAQFRELARLLLMEAQLHAVAGDWGPALEVQLDGLAAGLAVPRGSPLIGGLVGVAMQSVTRREAWWLLGELSADDAGPAARRLEALLAGQSTWADLLETEFEGSRVAVAKLLNELQPAALAGLGFDALQADKLKAWLIGTSRREAFAAYRAHLDWQLDALRDPAGAGPPPPPNPLSEMLMPALGPAALRWQANDAQNRLLLVALAVRADLDADGRPPATLDALVPRWLTAVPEDPFAPGQPLRMSVVDGEVVVYSVGPDGRDDGGEAIVGTVAAESKGDIVGGVTR